MTQDECALAAQQLVNIAVSISNGNSADCAALLTVATGAFMGTFAINAETLADALDTNDRVARQVALATFAQREKPPEEPLSDLEKVPEN